MEDSAICGTGDFGDTPRVKFAYHPVTAEVVDVREGISCSQGGKTANGCAACGKDARTYLDGDLRSLVRGWHTVAFATSPAWVWLSLRLMPTPIDVCGRLSRIALLATSVLITGTSTALHVVPWKKRWHEEVATRVDHAAIYIQIMFNNWVLASRIPKKGLRRAIMWASLFTGGLHALRAAAVPSTSKHRNVGLELAACIAPTVALIATTCIPPRAKACLVFYALQSVFFFTKWPNKRHKHYGS